LRKRILPLLLSIIICLAGCRGDLSDITNSAAQQTINAAPSQSSSSDVSFDEIRSINIPYDPEDSLLPYTAATSVNRYVCGLIYDSLVRLRPDYSYEKVMAKQISSEDYTVWTITIPGNITFPDGDVYSADDVKYSLMRAMTEGSFYAQSLSGVGNVAVKDDYNVEVTLLEADRYFANLLTFPIIEYGTMESPVGVGRYTLSSDKRTLTCNTAGAPIDTINLVDISDSSMLLQETRIGVFDCVYIEDPTSVSMSSIGGADPVPLNNLVYLGMNSHLGFTSGAKFRSAIEKVIDRGYIADTVYGGHAAAAPSVFNPAFYEMDAGLSRGADPQEANSLLDDLGYTERDSDGYRVSGYSGQRIVLDLAVNNESSVKMAAAAGIKNMLKQIGVDVNIVGYSYQAYLSAVENGAAELYIAEIKLPADMDVTQLISPEGTASYGLYTSDDLYADWLSLRSGNFSYADFDAAFYDATPFAPLVYRYGDFVYSRNFYFDVKATENDIFYNILEWE